MKYLVLAMMLSSCSTFQAVKNAFDVTYKAGQARERSIILEHLEENKKKQRELGMMVVADILKLVQNTKEDEEPRGDLILEAVIPYTGMWAVLKREESNLKKELEVANASPGESDSE